MLTANYVFAALDQVAAEVTKTYLHAREQHMQRGTRARARLFHALISDNFDSELELQKQALALNMPIGATGYVAVVCTLIVGNREGERGGRLAGRGRASLELPRGAISPHDRPDHAGRPLAGRLVEPTSMRARQFVMQLQAEAMQRSGTARRARARRHRRLSPRPARRLPLVPRGSAGDRGRAASCARMASCTATTR